MSLDGQLCILPKFPHLFCEIYRNLKTQKHRALLSVKHVKLGHRLADVVPGDLVFLILTVLQQQPRKFLFITELIER